MTQLLNEAFAVASQLSPKEQDALARLILQEIEQKIPSKSTKKSRPLQPVTEELPQSYQYK